MTRWLTGLLGLLLLAGLSGCTAVRMEAKPQLPPPLIEQLPQAVAVHYPAEFREFLYREERYGMKYEFLLGPAHVVKLQRLLEAMFAKVVEVDDPRQARAVAPDVRLVLEPRFEDYAFLTPQDMAGDYFTVTIRYRLDLYSPEGERVDGYVFTGFGREKSGKLGGNTAPLSAATQRAMRDAGAKLAVELASQDTVRRLLEGYDVQPVVTEAQQVQEALGSFGPPQAAPGVPAGEGEARATGAPADEALPGTATESGDAEPGGSPGPETPPIDPAGDSPPAAT
jgi:hypothetical protein